MRNDFDFTANGTLCSSFERTESKNSSSLRIIWSLGKRSNPYRMLSGSLSRTAAQIDRPVSSLR